MNRLFCWLFGHKWMYSHPYNPRHPDYSNGLEEVHFINCLRCLAVKSIPGRDRARKLMGK